MRPCVAPAPACLRPGLTPHIRQGLHYCPAKRPARGVILHSVAHVTEEKVNAKSQRPSNPALLAIEKQEENMTEEEIFELTAAQYENLDERLDALEYHVMELTRELRLGVASDTDKAADRRSRNGSMNGSMDVQNRSPAEKLQHLIQAIADVRKQATANVTRREAAASRSASSLDSMDTSAEGTKPQGNGDLASIPESDTPSPSGTPSPQAAAEQVSTEGDSKKSSAERSKDGDDTAKKSASPKAGDPPAVISRNTMYEFNKLQAGMTELMNSGYIESVKQLRETLMIMEWDMTNKHQAKKRAIATFERYAVEHDLVTEVGGYHALSTLYEDPDALVEVLPTDKTRMLARSMIEESLSDRRMVLYHACNATAKEMATLTRGGGHGGGLNMGSFMQVFSVIKGRVFPFLKLMPLARFLPFGAVLASLASAIYAIWNAIPFLPGKPQPA